MNRLTRLISLIILTSLLVTFQNCSRVTFTNLSSSLASAISLPSGQTLDGNGTGYGGKLSGTFYRFNPEFSCEGREAPVASITATNSGIQLMENKKLMCAAVNTALTENLVDRSVFQKDIIGFYEGIFENEQAVPTSIPANLVEVWCKDTNDRSGYETITHYNRTTQEAVTRVYYSNAAGDPVLINDFASARLVAMNRVTVTAGPEFSLEVRRDQPSSQIGIFNGSLHMTINGHGINRETFCRLGGNLDPKIWPAKQIVDSNIAYFQVAPSLKTFAFTSSTGFNSPQLFSGPVSGGPQKRVTPNLFARGAGAISFTPDSMSLIYWADTKIDYVSELFKVSIDGSSPQQLNSPLNSINQSGRMEYQISNDGSTLVYLDGHQNTFVDNEMSLSSVPIQGGLSVELSPPSNGVDVGAHDFVLSKSKNKVAFYFGFTSYELYFSNLDGTSLKNIKVNYPLYGNWKIQFGAKISAPEPGNFVIVRSYSMTGKTNFLTTALAIDESTQIHFPLDYEYISADPTGSKALIYNLMKPSQLQIINLATGVLIPLPSLISYAFNFNGTALLANELLTDGQMQNISIDTTTGIKTILCPETTAALTWILENGNGRLLISSWDASRSALQIYLNESTVAQCRKVATLPMSKPTGLTPFISPDSLFVVMKASFINKINMSNVDHLYYIPLNGKIPMQIDSPTYNSAQISDVVITSDSKSVLFVGDQLVINDKTLFLWKTP